MVKVTERAEVTSYTPLTGFISSLFFSFEVADDANTAVKDTKRLIN